ncbi:unnamed protein product [Pleuronectes platessa]|uniref:Uncharacterized protein n=1 Tax=Pleuronectes platessa TaxID=8262 RepID=A0A9N7YWJ8_PLEPL|nr:unnamed protein product [Pleuronectes platessa]
MVDSQNKFFSFWLHAGTLEPRRVLLEISTFNSGLGNLLDQICVTWRSAPQLRCSLRSSSHPSSRFGSQQPFISSSSSSSSSLPPPAPSSPSFSHHSPPLSLPHPLGVSPWSHAHDSSSHMETFAL